MRHTVEVMIATEGRDKGKRFLLTEMSAVRAEDWAVRAFLALAKSGQEIPEDIASRGLAGIAALGLSALAGASYADLKPLMSEMFDCVQIMEPSVTRKPTDDDFEEIGTRLQLRKEVLALHTDFFSGSGR